MNLNGCPEYERLSRRAFMKGVAGVGAAGFLGLTNSNLLFGQTGPRSVADSVILLWMGGGQSHIDTWDPKPGTDTGGPFSAIDTSVKGIKISEHLPNLARRFDDLSLIRSLTSREGSHERARYLLHTGYVPLGSFQHSTLGSVISKMRGPKNRDLPPYVNIGGQTWPAGYVGSTFAPFHIGDPSRPTSNLDHHRSINARRFNQRLGLLKNLDRQFARRHEGKKVVEAYANHFQAAFDMMRSKSVEAFDLSQESDAVRQRFGLTFFGQGCLLARRLVQVGIRFVEVSLGGWDTHRDNFDTVQSLSATLDVAVSSLVDDLRRVDLLERTLVVVCGEFGRTPRINGDVGRDHWPRVWSAMLAGGGIQGGRVFGESTVGGQEVSKDPCEVGRLHATICRCLDIDPTEMNYAPDGRPIRIVKETKFKAIRELFA
jgi:Protein of unknown function (DUF1501)